MENTMNSKRFARLKDSIVEAGTIIEGSAKPAREFSYEIVRNPEPSQTLWSVCLESSDHSLLIPRRLYLVTFGESGAWVRDENGEMTVTDKEDFLPIAFTPEVEEKLSIAA